MPTADDFTRWADKAADMSDAALAFSLSDCITTAEAMDKIDRAEGGDRAGRYRDEACAYRTEINRRKAA